MRMYRIPSKLEEFVEDAKELEEEIAVDIVSRGDNLFVVAMNEDKTVKYEEFCESMEMYRVKYDEGGKPVEVMEPWRPLYAISQSYGRVSELVEYLNKEGIDAYDVEERRCKRNAAEFIGRSKLESKEFEGTTDGMDEDEIKELAIKIGMGVLEG